MALSDEEVLAVFRERDAEELSTPAVAEELSISKPATWRRLSKLSERGLLERNVEGRAGETWVLTESGRDELRG